MARQTKSKTQHQLHHFSSPATESSNRIGARPSVKRQSAIKQPPATPVSSCKLDERHEKRSNKRAVTAPIIKRGRVYDNLKFVQPECRQIVLPTLEQFGVARSNESTILWGQAIQDCVYFFKLLELKAIIYPISDKGLANAIQFLDHGSWTKKDASNLKDARRRIAYYLDKDPHEILHLKKALSDEVVGAVCKIFEEIYNLSVFNGG